MSKEEELQTLVALKKQHQWNIVDKMNAINISFDYNQMKATLLGERHTMPDFKNLAEIEDWLDNL